MAFPAYAEPVFVDDATGLPAPHVYAGGLVLLDCLPEDLGGGLVLSDPNRDVLDPQLLEEQEFLLGGMGGILGKVVHLNRQLDGGEALLVGRPLSAGTGLGGGEHGGAGQDSGEQGLAEIPAMGFLR